MGSTQFRLSLAASLNFVFQFSPGSTVRNIFGFCQLAKEFKHCSPCHLLVFLQTHTSRSTVFQSRRGTLNSAGGSIPLSRESR